VKFVWRSTPTRGDCSRDSAEPKILILDEATSSLDSESEALIQDGLQSLRRDAPLLSSPTACRRSAVRIQILVLEGGEIIERGTHEELLSAGGAINSCTTSSIV